MKLLNLVSTTALLFLITTSRATEPPQAAASPYGPIAFLIGGVWRGELPPAPDGKKIAIELRCAWAANHQGIRFDGAFLIDGKPAPYTSGSYNWDAAKRQIVFRYSDADGNLTDGAVELESGALVHNFNIVHADGNTERARAVITPRGADAYTNDIFVSRDGSLQKMVSVEYKRGAE